MAVQQVSRPILHRLPKLIHDITNELQAIDGFLELAPKSPQLDKARAEMKEVFRLMRQLRKICDASGS